MEFLIRLAMIWGGIALWKRADRQDEALALGQQSEEDEAFGNRLFISQSDAILNRLLTKERLVAEEFADKDA